MNDPRVALIKAICYVIIIGVLTGTSWLLGSSHGFNSRNTEVNRINADLAQAKTDRLVLQGKVDGMINAANVVKDNAVLFQAQADARKADLQKVLNAVSKPVPRTGNACVDAHSVAVQYFNQLHGGAK